MPTLVQVLLEAGLNIARARLPLLTLPSRRGAEALFHAGAATTLNQLLNWAGLNAPSLITSNLLGTTVLGFYARAANLQNTALQLSGGPVGRVLVPTFASLQGDKAALRDTFKRFMSVVLPLNALVTTVAVVHAEAMVRLLLGRKWFAAVPLVQLLFLGFLPRSAYKVSEALALGSGQYGATALRQAIYFVAVGAGAMIGGAYGIQPLTLGVSLGLWVFYGFSLAQAEGLTQTGWPWLALAHGRALLLALLVGLPDAAMVFAVRHLRHPANPGSFKALILILASHAAGGLVALGMLVVLATSTGKLFGPAAAEARGRIEALLAAGRARLSPSRAPG